MWERYSCSAYGLRIICGLLCLACLAQGASMRCCVHANGSCRSACEQINLFTLATDDQELEASLQNLNKLCSKPYMTSFWNCVNETLEEIDRGRGWIGRGCCNLPQAEKCELACFQAQSLLDLTSSCRKSDEIPFYTCVERREQGERCCKNAQTSSCLEACKSVFADAYTPPKEVREAVRTHCFEGNPKVQQCVHGHIEVTPAHHPYKNLHCCDISLDASCRSACKEVLRKETTSQDILRGLKIGNCGDPVPTIRFWQCILEKSVANEPGGSLISSERIGIDGAKLQCCPRAATVSCKRLCTEAFSNQYNSWREFDTLCPSQAAEHGMIQCITEVDEPCELGCDGLSYCTNFNNRPTELFRSCTPRSDKAAQLDVSIWSKGVIKLPMVQIPVLNTSECLEVWKTIACALHIKPCHYQAHVNMICRSDCIDILTKCVDRRRLNNNQTPISICEILSPPENTPCISLAPYMRGASTQKPTTQEITHPCKKHHCNETEICMVNRNCLIGQPCFQYVCVPGCRMGDTSRLMIPQNSSVRVPSNTHGPRCHMVCYCNQNGVLEDCETHSCLGQEPCFHEGKKYNHNTMFIAGCKTCFCYDSEVTCSPNTCNSGLPCNCQDHYVPVCGANGKTYPSACLARCIGLTDDQFEFGACYDSDPCSPNSCHPYHKCVPKKRVCLSIRHRSCKQYDCVNMQNNCNQLPKFPVCDTDNVEHPNICWMLQRRKELAYYGKCMSHCRGRGVVCGHNGETYASECAAWAERVSVDYLGACSAVGSKHGKNSRCGGIKCSPLPSEYCPIVFPPGGCCPICGAALRLLYSQKQSDWSVAAKGDVDPVVIQTIAEKFREHVKVTECEVFAYLSLESDIIVLVMAISDSPTKIQVEACVREAEKLQSLIQQQSPRLLTHLPLSYFTTATMIDSVSDNSAQVTSNFYSLLATLLTTFVTAYMQKVL